MPYHLSKPGHRFLLAFGVAFLMPLLVLAQFPAKTQAPVDPKEAAAPKKDEPPTEAELLIDEAITKLKALTSVEADVVQDVSMLGQEFRVNGQYIKGPGYQFRLELNLSNLADVGGTMLQICDGQTLWNYQKVLNAQDYQRLGIDRILKRLDGPEFDDTFRERVISQFGFSGPDALLTGLRKAVLFDQKEEDVFEGKDVWVIRGSWKDRNALTGQGQAPLAGPIPAYIPSVVAVTIAKDNGWPYKVELRGRPRASLGLEKKGAAAKSGNSRQETISTVVLLYKNVRLNGTLDPARFAFQAPDPRMSNVVDQTEEFLAGLEKAAQVSLQTRKAEAGREALEGVPSSGALDQPIPLPKSDPAPASSAPRAKEQPGRP